MNSNGSTSTAVSSGTGKHSSGTVTLMVNDLVQHLRSVPRENWKPIVTRLKTQWQRRLQTQKNGNDVKDFKALWSEAKKKASEITNANAPTTSTTTHNNRNRYPQTCSERSSNSQQDKPKSQAFHPKLIAQVKEDVLETCFGASPQGLTEELKWSMAMSKESWRYRLLQKREELARAGSTERTNAMNDPELTLATIPSSSSSFDDFWNQVITALAPTVDFPAASLLLEKDLPDIIFEAVLPAVVAKVHQSQQPRRSSSSVSPNSVSSDPSSFPTATSPAPSRAVMDELLDTKMVKFYFLSANYEWRDKCCGSGNGSNASLPKRLQMEWFNKVWEQVQHRMQAKIEETEALAKKRKQILPPPRLAANKVQRRSSNSSVAGGGTSSGSGPKQPSELSLDELVQDICCDIETLAEYNHQDLLEVLNERRPEWRQYLSYLHRSTFATLWDKVLHRMQQQEEEEENARQKQQQENIVTDWSDLLAGIVKFETFEEVTS